MNILYPKFPRDRLAAMLRIAVLGAVVAGCYGAAHDQISYAISPEYFTKLKFRQFSYADFGWPPRLFAAEIGFIASFWVGLLGGWFAARAGLTEVPAAARRKCTLRVFGIVLIAAVVAGLVGALLGMAATRDGIPGGWDDLTAAGIEDPRGFVIVAYLHAGGYLGALLGLVLAIIYLRRSLVHNRQAQAELISNR